jgi:hypothetical protein
MGQTLNTSQLPAPGTRGSGHADHIGRFSGLARCSAGGGHRIPRHAFQPMRAPDFSAFICPKYLLIRLCPNNKYAHMNNLSELCISVEPLKPHYKVLDVGDIFLDPRYNRFLSLPVV